MDDRSGHASASKHEKFFIGLGRNLDVNACCAQAAAYLRSKNLIPIDEKLSQPNFLRILAYKFKKLRAEYRFESSETIGKEGIFTSKIRLPSSAGRGVSPALEFEFRSAADLATCRTHYLLLPIRIAISNPGSTPDENSALLALGNQYLERQNFLEYDLSSITARLTESRRLPIHWIMETAQQQQLKVSKVGGSQNYSLILSSERARRPPVAFSLGTASESRAALALQIFQENILPRLKAQWEADADASVLPEEIKSEVLAGMPPDSPVISRKASEPDLRFVPEDAPKVVMGKPTRYVRYKNGIPDYHYRLRIAPPKSEGSLHNFSTLGGKLNTDSEKLADARAGILQHLCEIALRRYYLEHEDAELATEISEKGRIFSARPPGAAGGFYFEDLCKVIKPALENFDRLLFFDTSATRLSDHEYIIKFQARRGDGESIPEEIAGEFAKEMQVTAPSAESAARFRKIIESTLLEDQVFGRRRGVETISNASLRVVLRESVRMGLRDRGIIPARGSVLERLQRDPNFLAV